MKQEPTARPDRSSDSRSPCVALLIDWENVKASVTNQLGSPPDIITLKKIARQFGKIAVARAYANWADPWHEGDLERLAKQGIEPVFVLTRPSGTESAVPNSADLKLACDGMGLLATSPALSCFVIVSGDGSLTHLINCITQSGKRAVRIATAKSMTYFLQGVGEERVTYNLWMEGLKFSRNAAAVANGLKYLETTVETLHNEGLVPTLSTVKDLIREVVPQFEEEGLGIPSFRHLAYLAEDKGKVLIDARKEPAVAYPLGSKTQTEGVFGGAIWSAFIRRVWGIEGKSADFQKSKGERTGLSYKALLSVASTLPKPPDDPTHFVDVARDSQVIWSRPSTKYYSTEHKKAMKADAFLLNLHHPRVQVALIKGPIVPTEGGSSQK